MKIFNANTKIKLHMRVEGDTLIIWTGMPSAYLDEAVIEPRGCAILGLETVISPPKVIGEEINGHN